MLNLDDPLLLDLMMKRKANEIESDIKKPAIAPEDSMKRIPDVGSQTTTSNSSTSVTVSGGIFTVSYSGTFYGALDLQKLIEDLIEMLIELVETIDEIQELTEESKEE